MAPVTDSATAGDNEHNHANALAPQSENAQHLTTSSYAKRGQADLAALPPAGMPIKDTLIQLKQLAHEGNARAACLLAVQARNCGEEFAMNQRLSRQLAQPPQAGEPEDMHREFSYKNAVSYVERYAPYCANVDSTQLPEPRTSMLQAAQLGYAPAMADYASLRGFKGEMFKDAAFKQWQIDAAQMLERAVHLGDVTALQTRLTYLIQKMRYSNPNDGSFDERDILGPLIPDTHQALVAFYGLTAIREQYSPLPATASSLERQSEEQYQKFLNSLQQKLLEASSIEAQQQARSEAESLARGWNPQLFKRPSFVDPKSPAGQEQLCRNP